VTGKRGGKPPHTPPAQGRLSLNPSAISIVTFNSPPFLCVNVRPEDSLDNVTDNEYKCSFCLEYFWGSIPDDKNPLVLFDSCGHRLCRECITTSMGKLPNCLVADCGGTTCGTTFRFDQELIYRIIEKRCSVLDGKAVPTNKGIAVDVAGSRCTKKLLTSG
jgi:hypothetical protein